MAIDLTSIVTKAKLIKIVNGFKTWISGKYVAKEDGKGLSTNDFTTELKDKLEKQVVTDIPNKISSFENDANYATSEYVSTVMNQVQGNIPSSLSAFTNDPGYVDASYVDTKIAQSVSGLYSFVGACYFEDLPTDLTADDKGKTYNVLNEFIDNDVKYAAGTNVAWTGEGWDPLGGQAFDATGFLTPESFGEISDEEIDALFAD